MRDKGSVFQTGGGGTNFEQYIQTAFLATLIIRGNAPCLPKNEIIELAFQNKNRGLATDDLLVIAESSIGKHRLLCQAKYNIVFSSNDIIFKKVIADFWMDFNNGFDRERDRLVIIKNRLNNTEKNQIKGIFNFAKTHSSEGDFISEVSRIKEKKEKLDLFRSVLTEANNGMSVGDKDVWSFLKCLDVLGYDFMDHGSVDETNFLNLIKLSKSNLASSNERDIWNGLIAFITKFNPNGGSVTIESIQKEEIYRHFDSGKLGQYFDIVKKLKSDGEIIFGPIKSSINGLHLDRENTRKQIIDSIESSPFTIVTGLPGAGKSAVVKDIITNEFASASVFVFRADQFNRPHLANVFAEQGFTHSLIDIFSSISLVQDRIIVIDSMEKLLEGESESAFKQLISTVQQYPSIKIIGTTRKYAVDLIAQKFGLDPVGLHEVEVPKLTDQELKEVLLSFPELKNIVNNAKLKQLLQSPKYLEFAIITIGKKSEDFSKASQMAFKENLWSSIVKDNLNRQKGLPDKREDAFLHIAVTRARKMKLFVKALNVDQEAIALLENDGIIFQENNSRQYTPAHDILEDWALVKHVSTIYEENPTPKGLLSKLGNEPAMRRAFRLWVEDYLTEDSEKINDLVRNSLTDSSIEQHLTDDLLVAIFKSNDCGSFFKSFEKDLLSGGAQFLNRCIQLLKTSCKESGQTKNNLPILLPIGSGWKQMLLFIQAHQANLEILRLSVIKMLFDWQFMIWFHLSAVDTEEMLAAKDITIGYLNEMELGIEFWQSSQKDDAKSQLILLLYDMAAISESEITGFIKRAIDMKSEKAHWSIRSFYDLILKKALSGVNSRELAKAIPDVIIEIATNQWKRTPNEKEPVGIIKLIGPVPLSHEESWGFVHFHDFFPSGIYKMPAYNLMAFHPFKGIKFITDLINYSIECYVKSNCERKYGLKQIAVELNDGTTIQQWASFELWVAYRGMSVTHYLLECLLMSLEKFLLEVACVKTEGSRLNLKLFFDILLRLSNNIAITGVLSSVAMAYPEEVGEAMIPIIGIKEVYSWDLNRHLKESSAMAPQDDEISYAQKQRFESNQLPHRTAFHRGFGEFIANYQFNIRTINEQIYKQLDKLHLNADKEDILWKKWLNEIDVRNWQITKDETVEGRMIIQPKYEESVNSLLEAGKKELALQTAKMNYSWILASVIEGKEEITLSIWQNCYLHYSKDTSDLSLFDRPISLAVIGLRDLPNDLNDDQKQWSLKTIIDAIILILQNEFHHSYDVHSTISPSDREIALGAFHLLVDNANEDDKKAVIALMIYTLFAPFGHYEVKKIIKYIRDVFYKRHPNEAKKVWVGLIHYAKFRKSNPYFYDYNDPKKEDILSREQELIESLSAAPDLTINLDEIDFDNYEGYILARAITIIPLQHNELIFGNFIQQFTPLFLKDLKNQWNHSRGRNKSVRSLSPDDVRDLQKYFSDSFLYDNNDLLYKNFMETFFKAIETDHNSNDLYELLSSVLEYVALKLFDLLVSSDDKEITNKASQRFWQIWELFYAKIKESKHHPFLSTLFLNIRYLLYDPNGRVLDQCWKPLENSKDFYHKLILEFSGYKIAQYVIDLFSIIGEIPFLPSGISWLRELLEKHPEEAEALVSPSGERLIKKLYNNHMTVIKKDARLLNDLLWILENMIKLGSSQAYWYRENVIIYKVVS